MITHSDKANWYDCIVKAQKCAGSKCMGWVFTSESEGTCGLLLGNQAPKAMTGDQPFIEDYPLTAWIEDAEKLYPQIKRSIAVHIEQFRVYYKDLRRGDWRQTWLAWCRRASEASGMSAPAVKAVESLDPNVPHDPLIFALQNSIGIPALNSYFSKVTILRDGGAPVKLVFTNPFTMKQVENNYMTQIRIVEPEVVLTCKK